MNTPRAITSVCVSALLFGCAIRDHDTSVANGFPAVERYTLQSAAHWQAAATRMAKRLSASLKETRPLHLPPAPGRSTFEQVFINQLAAALLEEGFTLQKAPAGALTVDVSTQAIRFLGERPAQHAADAGSPEARDARPSHTEVVVTVTVTDANREWFKHGEVYPVADADGRLYETLILRRPSPTRHIAVVGQ
ncbi:MAG TPA: hypothetical protein PKN13_10335 [Accumulibacter sp.]|nr:hypothetical protein [Accumulibacter sp.]HMW17078.1 hypothetical protein [Accumulibacter sp.]HNC18203.1 hypothetical protein [Accumulibacter sp.]HND79879.1 hypothetical protein [Accumulibacter sp.]HNE12274.1 hypothetical protein [Accumulibacter sp.]